MQKHLYIIYPCLKNRDWLRLTGTNPTTGFSFSLPGKTLRHPEDPCSPGMRLWPAEHNTT